METAFVIYVLYAAVILIWSSSSQPDIQIRYVVISTTLLKEGVFPGANPLIIDLRPAQPGTGPAACIPGALVVSRDEFGSLVRWTPPGATLVFCDYAEGSRLDRRVEQRLLELNIDAVYWASMQLEYTAKRTTTGLGPASVNSSLSVPS